MSSVLYDGLAEDGSVGHHGAEDEHDAGQHPQRQPRHTLKENSSEQSRRQTGIGDFTDTLSNFTFERI